MNQKVIPYRETQASVHQWTLDVFPHHGENEPKLRTLRILEEAIELCLAEGVNLDQIDNVKTGVIAKEEEKGKNNQYRAQIHEPIGPEAQLEAADLLAVLYAYAGTRGFDLHQILDEKMLRNRGLPKDYFAKKYQQKTGKGMNPWSGEQR